jgi:Tol biopolymer transport system component
MAVFAFARLAKVESRALTDVDTIALNPVFSPDNTAIAFTNISNNGRP